MAQYMKLSTFRATQFVEGEAPTEATIKKLILSDEIPGKRIGRDYYIDLQKFILTDNDLVNKVLMAS